MWSSYTLIHIKSFLGPLIGFYCPIELYWLGCLFLPWFKDLCRKSFNMILTKH